ncbi:unnamed protein product [Arctogadus glacialis]
MPTVATYAKMYAQCKLTNGSGLFPSHSHGLHNDFHHHCDTFLSHASQGFAPPPFAGFRQALARRYHEPRQPPALLDPSLLNNLQPSADCSGSSPLVEGLMKGRMGAVELVPPLVLVISLIVIRPHLGSHYSAYCGFSAGENVIEVVCIRHRDNMSARLSSSSSSRGAGSGPLP